MSLDQKIISPNQGYLLIDINHFRRAALDAACYVYTDRYFISITEDTDNKARVTLQRKESDEVDAKQIEHDINELYNHILDHQVRLELIDRNGHLRDLIVKHAFEPISRLEEALK